MSRVAAWFQERVPVSGAELRELTNEPVPNHLKRWWFALGGTPAYLFIVQIATGILLAVYYQPSSTSAYQSVRYISEEAATAARVAAVEAQLSVPNHSAAHSEQNSPTSGPTGKLLPST